MDREILFRGMDDNKRLIQGYFFQKWEDCFILWGTTNGVPNMTKVDPATVGQYAFLNDIDDKKIFTADILQDKITSDLYIVDFIGGGFGLFTMKEYIDLKHRHKVILWDGLSELQTSCFVMQNLGIIGNIHDNPELVKEEESE